MPKIYIDGMKIMAEFKPSKKKADEQEQYLPEPVERKQQLTAEKVRVASYTVYDTAHLFCSECSVCLLCVYRFLVS